MVKLYKSDVFNVGRICEGFIKAYISAACDRDPTGNIYRMPGGLTKLDLHSLYQTIHKDGIGKSKFYQILDSKFRNLIFCKVIMHSYDFFFKKYVSLKIVYQVSHH